MISSALRSVVSSAARGGVGGDGSDGYAYVNGEARTLVGAMAVKPNATRKGLIDALITGLKADSLWNILDAVYLTAAHDRQAGTLNWKAPGTFTLVESGTGTWTTDRGWAGNGTDGRLTTGAAPSAMTNLLQDSATAFLWSRTAAASGVPALGLALNNTFQIIPRFTGDTFQYRVNQSTSTSAANTDGTGLYSTSRTGASTTQGYKNGAALGVAGAIASAARSANSIILGGNTTSYTTTQIAAAGFGAGMDATQNANLYTRLQTFMAAIGAA